jgi:hypothetical protein
MSVATAGYYQSGRRAVVGSPSGDPTLIQPPFNGNRAGLWPLSQSALNAFSIVSSIGPSSEPLAFCLINSIDPPQDRPLVRIQVTRRPDALPVLFPNRREIGHELFRDSRTGSRPHARHRGY